MCDLTGAGYDHQVDSSHGTSPMITYLKSTCMKCRTQGSVVIGSVNMGAVWL